MKNTLKKLAHFRSQQQKLVVGEIIQNQKEIESVLDLVLVEYIGAAPEKYDFMRKVLFSSSFLGFAQKINLFAYINKKEGWFSGEEKNALLEKLRKVLKTRNAFAHDFGESAAGINIDGVVDFNYKVRVFHGEDFGVLEYDETLEEYQKNCEYVSEKLEEIAIGLYA